MCECMRGCWLVLVRFVDGDADTTETTFFNLQINFFISFPFFFFFISYSYFELDRFPGMTSPYFKRT